MMMPLFPRERAVLSQAKLPLAQYSLSGGSTSTVSPWIALPRRKEPNVRVPEQFAILVSIQRLGYAGMYGPLVQTFGTDLRPRHPEGALVVGFSSVGSSGT